MAPGHAWQDASITVVQLGQRCDEVGARAKPLLDWPGLGGLASAQAIKQMAWPSEIYLCYGSKRGLCCGDKIHLHTSFGDEILSSPLASGSDQGGLSMLDTVGNCTLPCELDREPQGEGQGGSWELVWDAFVHECHVDWWCSS